MGIYRQKNSRYWWFKFEIRGRRHCGSTLTTDKALARSIFEKKRTEALEGRFFDKKTEYKTTVQEMVDTYIRDYSTANKRSVDTDRHRVKPLLKFFGRRRLIDISKHTLEQYKSSRRLEVKNPTVNRELALLKAIYNKAIEWGMAEKNPVKGVRMLPEEPKKYRVLEADEKTRLLEACSPIIRPVVLAALNTGMRKEELLALRWDDVSIKRASIFVRKSKSGRARTIPANATMLQILRGLDRAGPTVFTDAVGAALKGGGRIRTNFELAVEAVGLEPYVFHDLRHQFASELVMKGWDLMTVKELLGHSSLRMVQRYAHLTPKHIAAAVATLADPNLGCGSDVSG